MTTEWKPKLGKRRRRRPKRRRRDDITAFIGTTWARQVEYRCAWKEYEEA